MHDHGSEAYNNKNKPVVYIDIKLYIYNIMSHENLIYDLWLMGKIDKRYWSRASHLYGEFMVSSCQKTMECYQSA